MYKVKATTDQKVYKTQYRFAKPDRIAAAHARNLSIVETRLQRRTEIIKEYGAIEGCWLQLPGEEKPRRIAMVYNDGTFQLSRGTAVPHLTAEGGATFSGSLDFCLKHPNGEYVKIDELAPIGRVNSLYWIFDNNVYKAGNGFYFSIKELVYEIAQQSRPDHEKTTVYRSSH